MRYASYTGYSSRMLMVAAILGGVGAAMIAGPAAAAIACSKGFQKVQGSFIATPYCQDEYLAQVAREYGSGATGGRIRANPNYKNEVCRLVGRDIRVQSACVDSLPSNRGGRF